MTRKARKKGLHPLVAVVLLGVSGAVFAANILPMLRGSAREPASGQAMMASEAEPAAESAGETPLGDLLAQYGSYQPGTAVRSAFLQTDGAAVAAAPAGETQAWQHGAWQGEDPPQMQVSFLMLGGPVARAVIDGVVVGVGDVVAGCKVIAIRKDCVMLRHGVRSLTYGMDRRWPREFGRELQRRADKTKQGEEGGR